MRSSSTSKTSNSSLSDANIGSKDRLLGSLLQPSGGPKSKSLIEEMMDASTSATQSSETASQASTASKDSQASKVSVVPPAAPSTGEDGEMSMMEQMMAAQTLAKKDEDVKKKKLEKKANKGFGSGFKKGFLSGGSSGKKKSTTSATKTTEKKKDADVITVTKKADDGKAGVVGNVVQEVQEAMQSDNKMLDELKGGAWMTPDLTTKLKENPILSKGLTHPKCQAAIELMQKDPEKAKQMFGKDPEVDLFMREFGKVMSEHFMGLGVDQNTNSHSQGNSQNTPKVAPVQEVGPLQAEAMKKAKEMGQSTNVVPVDAEQEKVNAIINDPELSSILMDPNMQCVLQECNNPVKFNQHMKDPETARKINKLFSSGLVKVEK